MTLGTRVLAPGTLLRQKGRVQGELPAPSPAPGARTRRGLPPRALPCSPGSASSARTEPTPLGAAFPGQSLPPPSLRTSPLATGRRIGEVGGELVTCSERLARRRNGCGPAWRPPEATRSRSSAAAHWRGVRGTGGGLDPHRSASGPRPRPAPGAAPGPARPLARRPPPACGARGSPLRARLCALWAFPRSPRTAGSHGAPPSASSGSPWFSVLRRGQGLGA